jgi:hypothetical protein
VADHNGDGGGGDRKLEHCGLGEAACYDNGKPAFSPVAQQREERGWPSSRAQDVGRARVM